MSRVFLPPKHPTLFGFRGSRARLSSKLADVVWQIFNKKKTNLKFVKLLGTRKISHVHVFSAVFFVLDGLLMKRNLLGSIEKWNIKTPKKTNFELEVKVKKCMKLLIHNYQFQNTEPAGQQNGIYACFTYHIDLGIKYSKREVCFTVFTGRL